MNTQISTPIKIVAVVGLVLIVGVLGLTKMKGSSSGSDSSASSPVTTPAPATSTPATTTPSASHPSTHATPAAHAASKPAHAAAAKTHAVAKPDHVAPKAKPKPEPVAAVAADGLPGALDELLHIHQVVVVAVYDPEVPTDKLFVGEAQAGATNAHAGFFAVSVLNERVAGPLTAAAGNGSLLPSPGLLIFKEPAQLANVITGFIDRDAVSAAVVNAETAQPTDSTTSDSTPAAPTTTTVTPTGTTVSP